MISENHGSTKDNLGLEDMRDEKTEKLFDVKFTEETMSLQQIITCQLDQPKQKECIFMTKISQKEQEVLVNSLFSCKEPSICPAGKATFKTLTLEEIDQLFAR